jgi:hypothetical protein
MRIRNVVLLVSLSCVLGVQVAHSQALLAPVENLVINRAEAAIMSRIAIARGFAANDPRIASTLTSMGQVSTALNVASTGVAVGLGFAGAPVWLTIAAGLGVIAAGSVIAGTLSSGTTSAQSLTVASDSSGNLGLQVSSASSVAVSGSPGITGDFSASYPGSYGQPRLYADASCYSSDVCSGFPARPASLPMYWKIQGTLGKDGHDIIDVGYWSLDELAQNVPLYQMLKAGQSRTDNTAFGIVTYSVSWISPPTWQTAPDGSTRLHGVYSYNAVCASDGCGLATNGPQTANWDSNVSPYPSGLQIDPSFIPTPVGATETVYPTIPQSLLGLPVDNNTLANLTNTTWQRAASQPDYQGLPYSVTQPVTANDVASWAQEDPQSVPNVNDLFRPAADPGSVVVISPTAQPGQVTTGSGSTDAGNNVNVVNTPNVNVVNKVSVDLGTDPGVASPTLEATPTISMILSPLLSLLPDLKHWAVPAHNAVCPEPSFSLLGHSFTLSAQCDLAESNRAAIYTAFAAMFTLAALFIVLRA